MIKMEAKIRLKTFPTMGVMKILYLLKIQGEMNVITIAKKLGLSYPYTHKLISELTARKFIKTRKVKRERFVKLIKEDFSELLP